MSDIFNFNRFGKYLAYDLKSRWSENRVYILVWVLIPAICYLGLISISAIWNGFTSAFTNFHLAHPQIATRVSVFTFSAIVFMLQFPSKAYGFITEKAKGSAWVELPASRLEKYSSMMLITLIIIPLVFFIGYLLCDGIICLIDKACGSSIFGAWIGLTDDYGPFNADGDVSIWGRGFWWLASPVLMTASVFLLGALIFKKGKVSRTVLALFLISMIVFSLGALVMSHVNVEAFGNNLRNWMIAHVDNLDILFNSIGNLIMAVVVIGCGIWSWFRVKNVQH
ncbi:MAG: hypothetical protein J5886_00040 [Bacteroidales bacterium]|nr:hypothetical protein [Bacteroidales bacterium]